jgi:hypothetical protein
MATNGAKNMKPIKFEIDEIPQTGSVDEEGNFKFYIYGSNMLDNDFTEAIATMQKLWDLEIDVALKVNIKFREIYTNLFDMYNVKGRVGAKNTPLFESLRKDCQWIIDQIDKMEKLT